MFPVATIPESAFHRGVTPKPADPGWILPAPSLSSSPVTMCLTLLCVVIALWPGANVWLQFDRSSILGGQWWRLFTGHFTHWSREHLAWDLLVFIVLGSICETAGVRRYLILLVAGSLVITLGVWTLNPSLETYRGLSGLDTALFAALAAMTFQAANQENKPCTALFIAALLASLLGKIAYEMLFAQALFVDASAAGFQPLPLAHLLGTAVGIAAGVCSTSVGDRKLAEPPIPGRALNSAQ